MRIRIVAALNVLAFAVIAVLGIAAAIDGGLKGWLSAALCALILVGQAYVVLQIRKAQGGHFFGPNRTFAVTEDTATAVATDA